MDFARDVRPLLARRCFPCHGNDEATREAGLRLDLEADALWIGTASRPSCPETLEASEVWARVNDEFDPMPPEEAGAPLDAAERELLRRWIEGARATRRTGASRRQERPASSPAGPTEWAPPTPSTPS